MFPRNVQNAEEKKREGEATPPREDEERTKRSGSRGWLAAMVCYNLYIFNRDGVCLHYREWSRPKQVKDGAGTLADDAKMMFGLLFSLKNVCTAIDPTR